VDLADFNAAEDLKPSDPSASREKRLALDAADLKLILEQSPMYTSKAILGRCGRPYGASR
jgi:hypothetical protein